jgi:hypothetical protein
MKTPLIAPIAVSFRKIHQLTSPARAATADGGSPRRARLRRCAQLSFDERDRRVAYARFGMRCGAGIAIVALMLASVASASRPATHGEFRWMTSNIDTGNGSFGEWARVSSRDPHYAVFFARRCHSACSQTQPTDVFLLRRTGLTERGWEGSLVAQAQLRPALVRDVLRLCREAPNTVRHELLAAICK